MGFRFYSWIWYIWYSKAREPTMTVSLHICSQKFRGLPLMLSPNFERNSWRAKSTAIYAIRAIYRFEKDGPGLLDSLGQPGVG